VVLLCFTTHVNSQDDSVKQLKFVLSSEKAAHQEKFVLLFQGINPAQVLCPENRNQRYMTFSSNYNTRLRETKSNQTAKFTQLQSVVLAYLGVYKEYTQYVFFDIGLRTGNIFILLIDCL